MDGITLYTILYYKKSIYKGSYKGMNFYIQKAGSDEEPTLRATAWRGPFAYDKTKEEKISKDFPFSDDGIALADAWLTELQKTFE